MDTIPDSVLTPSLETVLASPARFRTARLLSKLPEKEFTGRELARHLGLSHSTIQVTMRLLVDKGVATERRIGRACVFRANPDSVLLRALSHVFKAETWARESLLETIRTTLEKIGSAGIVFGSVARGEASEKSDLDLLVVTRDPKKTSEAVSTLEQLLIRRYGLHLDAKIVSPADLRSSDFAYVKAALAEGRVIDPLALQKVMAAGKD